MEGIHRAAEGYAYPAARVRPLGLRAAMPALLALAVVFGTLLAATALVSVAWYDDLYQLRFWPPVADAYFDDAPFVVALTIASLIRLLPPFLLATIPGGLAGYFLALKAPAAVRRWGLFLVLAAWVLTVPRTIGTLHLFSGNPGASWFPWMIHDFTGGYFVVLFYNALPPIALGVYSALRGEFLGLVWPDSSGTRSRRFVREALPRGAVGAAFGVLLAWASATFEGWVAELYGGGAALPIGSYIQTQLNIIGGATLAAAAILMALGMLVAVFLGFLGFTWLVRALGRLVASSPAVAASRQPWLSRVSMGITAFAFVFLVVSSLIPISLAAVFSFNAGDDPLLFDGWSTRWYANPGVQSGAFQTVGIFDDPDYWRFLLGSLGLSAVTAFAAAPLGVSAAAAVFGLPPRSRSAVRATLYMGFVVPLIMFAWMTYFVRALAVTSFPGLDVVGVSAAVLVFLSQLPLAIGISFVVAAASGSWRQAVALRSGPFVWIRPMVAGAFVSMAFLLTSYGLFTEYSQTAYIFGIVGKKILTPLFDAALVVLSACSFAALLAAWVLLRDQEGFRF